MVWSYFHSFSVPLFCIGQFTYGTGYVPNCFLLVAKITKFDLKLLMPKLNSAQRLPFDFIRVAHVSELPYSV